MADIITQHAELVLKTRKILNSRAEELLHATVGLSGETGEVAELIKKHVWHERSLDKEKLEKEIGDVLWYLQALCLSSGIGMREALVSNIAKLEKRHPDGFNALYDSTKD